MEQNSQCNLSAPSSLGVSFKFKQSLHRDPESIVRRTVQGKIITSNADPDCVHICVRNPQYLALSKLWNKKFYAVIWIVSSAVGARFSDCVIQILA